MAKILIREGGEDSVDAIDGVNGEEGVNFVNGRNRALLAGIGRIANNKNVMITTSMIAARGKQIKGIIAHHYFWYVHKAS